MELRVYLREKKTIIDKALDEILIPASYQPPKIHEAMRYSVFAGGKRLRPILCMAAAETVGGSSEVVMPIACALEFIHTYSLIHDDLPPMDDDNLRRGKPTNHVIFGEATAILAGDGLLTYAFEIISRYGLEHGEKDKIFQVGAEIAKAAGTLGMIGGQVVDMESENITIDSQTLEYIHHHKTGALIRASVRSGAILGGGNQREVEQLSFYADYLGLAFQITDDLLDVLGEEEKIGKPIGSDDKNKKATFPSIYGVSQSQEMAEDAVRKAIAALDIFGQKANPLRQLAGYLLNRDS
ncbi:MAG: polyprenyl synthetase family protein [Bacillota bacterium]